MALDILSPQTNISNSYSRQDSYSSQSSNSNQISSFNASNFTSNKSEVYAPNISPQYVYAPQIAVSSPNASQISKKELTASAAASPVQNAQPSISGSVMPNLNPVQNSQPSQSASQSPPASNPFDAVMANLPLLVLFGGGALVLYALTSKPPPNIDARGARASATIPLLG